MSTKEPLPQKMLEELIEALKAGNVKQENDFEFTEQTSFITVEECPGDAVCVEAGFYGDDVKSSATTPEIYYTMEVAGLTFKATQEGDYPGDWHLDSDKYSLSGDDMDIVEELLNEAVNVVDPWDFKSGCSFPESLSDEWSRDEVVEEIKKGLTYDAYIEYEGSVFPLTGTVKEFLQEMGYDYDDDDESCVVDEDEYNILTPDEAAELLADEVYNEDIY